MENLENENLISGIVDGADASVGQPVQDSTTGEDTGDREEVATEPGSADREVPDGKIAEIVERVFERMKTRLKEAEEAGFRRAIELARSNPEAIGIRTASAPNFLAEVRRDVWDN